MPWPLPRCEISHFAIVAVVRQPYFGAYEQYLRVNREYPAIESKISVYDGHPYVLEPVRRSRLDKLRGLRQVMLSTNGYLDIEALRQEDGEMWVSMKTYQEYTMTLRVRENACQHLPGVEINIILQKRIKAVITRDFKFRSHP